MKKNYLILLIVAIIICVGVGLYLLNIKKTSEVKYYTYDGKFVMSSYAQKVDDYKKLNNNYFIKEKISNVTSKEDIIEVLFSGGFNEPYFAYGYYTIDDFNKYFSEDIKKGLVCDGESIHYLAEATSYKCVKHKPGYKYQKIDSELCANINNQLVCIKANDWQNNANYKKMFENVGWQCEYYDYSTQEFSANKVPTNGYLECSKVKPSNAKKDNELFCYIETDGEVVCNNNVGWCNLYKDLSTSCFGID